MGKVFVLAREGGRWRGKVLDQDGLMDLAAQLNFRAREGNPIRLLGPRGPVTIRAWVEESCLKVEFPEG